MVNLNMAFLNIDNRWQHTNIKMSRCYKYVNNCVPNIKQNGSVALVRWQPMSINFPWNVLAWNVSEEEFEDTKGVIRILPMFRRQN